LTRDVILLDAFGITASALVQPGRVAVLMTSGEVKIVAAEVLRATVEQLGKDKVEGLTMAPADFEKVKAVIKRRSDTAGSQHT
jgi:hypothetical protein